MCWCLFLPDKPVEVSTNVYILQHPFEEMRCLRTAPMLHYGLQADKCHIIKGKKFSEEGSPEVAEILKLPNTLLLYPGPDAIDLAELPPCGRDLNYNLVILDGTWAQAKNMYLCNKILSLPKKVQINHSHKSKYVIRTQPDDAFLSTVETAAVALSILEQKPEILQILTKPLEALCKFQLEHGAVPHQSKTYKIENGLWTKKLKKKVIKKMEKEKQSQEND